MRSSVLHAFVGTVASLAQLVRREAVNLKVESSSLSGSVPFVKTDVSCGIRTHAQFPAVDLKSTPSTTRAD